MDRRQRLEKEIEMLKATLNRCFKKRLLTDDPVKEVALEELENELEIDLQKKEQELHQLSETVASKNRDVLTLERSLCNIDFEKAKEIIQDINSELTDNEGGSALFLMESCLEREGRLLLLSLKDILRANTSQFLEYLIEFLPIMPANEMAFLKILGKHLGLIYDDEFVDISEERLSEITEEIIKKISGLLRSGTTVLIPLTNWNGLDLAYQAIFLDWFMTKFWRPLVNSVSMVMEDYSPKVFCVIMVDNCMADICQNSEYFCEKTNFVDNRILRIPLTCWSQADIRRWLSDYSMKLKKSERNYLVECIFDRKDEELPLKIRVALEKAHSQSLF